MKHSFLIFPFLLALLSSAYAEVNVGESKLLPDSILLTNGTRLYGLIVKNNAKAVTLQERMSEMVIPKSSICRIEDQGSAGTYFAKPGKLPPWKMIVQDLRTDDSILSFQQIPATSITNGYLRNIPYLSYRINGRTEMNVYGNRNDPVCIEFGVYERGQKITQFKKIIRTYLAGIVYSRAEIKALYSLDEKGGEKRVGNLCFKVLPPSAPDAYGGWWMSVYEPKLLEQARVSDKAYQKVTLPFEEVNNKSGKLRKDQLAQQEKFLADAMMSWHEKAPDLRGFYRNKMGQLSLLISQGNSKKAPPVASSTSAP